MVRFRSRMALRPINRIKHVVDFSGALAQATNLPVTLVAATDTPTLANTSGVETGSTVHGVYLRVEVASNEAIDLGAIPNFYMIVWKNPGGHVTQPAANAVGADDAKRFVIHQEMTMIENKGQGSNARTVFNGVVVIPKGYKRMGPGDLLLAAFLCPALATVVCLQCHFKEFR